MFLKLCRRNTVLHVCFIENIDPVMLDGKQKVLSTSVFILPFKLLLLSALKSTLYNFYKGFINGCQARFRINISAALEQLLNLYVHFCCVVSSIEQ